MKNLLKTYPNIHLLLFCLLALVAGIEFGDVINNGLPKEKFKSGLKIFTIAINFVLAIYFFYCFVKIKNQRVKKSNGSSTI